MIIPCQQSDWSNIVACNAGRSARCRGSLQSDIDSVRTPAPLDGTLGREARYGAAGEAAIAVSSGRKSEMRSSLGTKGSASIAAALEVFTSTMSSRSETSLRILRPMLNPTLSRSAIAVTAGEKQRSGRIVSGIQRSTATWYAATVELSSLRCRPATSSVQTAVSVNANDAANRSSADGEIESQPGSVPVLAGV